jgi:peptidoglycan/LPS O-acetylase OafA/YrhL
VQQISVDDTLKYRPEVDGLRAIAVVPVIIFHTGLSYQGVRLLPGGFVGVDVFFVISGFLIARILHDELASNSFRFLAFYQRRARRILPALFFVLFACPPFAWMWMDAEQLQALGESTAAVALFLSNILYWTRSGYFFTASARDPLLHTWSLAVEEQFYLLFPLLLFLCWRYHRKSLSLVLLGLGLLSFSLGLAPQNPTRRFIGHTPGPGSCWQVR